LAAARDAAAFTLKAEKEANQQAERLIASLEQNLTECEARHVRDGVALEAQRANLSRSIQMLRSEVFSAKKQLTAANAEIKALESQLSSARRQVSEEAASGSALRAAMAKLEAAATSMQQKLDKDSAELRAKDEAREKLQQLRSTDVDAARAQISEVRQVEEREREGLHQAQAEVERLTALRGADVEAARTQLNEMRRVEGEQLEGLRQAQAEIQRQKALRRTDVEAAERQLDEERRVDGREIARLREALNETAARAQSGLTQSLRSQLANERKELDAAHAQAIWASAKEADEESRLRSDEQQAAALRAALSEETKLLAESETEPHKITQSEDRALRQMPEELKAGKVKVQ